MARKAAPTSTRLIPSKQQYLYDILVADIRLGRHPPGSPLPSEWDLVALYGISRTTVRGALAKLTAAGLVQTQQGHVT